MESVAHQYATFLLLQIQKRISWLKTELNNLSLDIMILVQTELNLSLDIMILVQGKSLKSCSLADQEQNQGKDAEDLDPGEPIS